MKRIGMLTMCCLCAAWLIMVMSRLPACGEEQDDAIRNLIQSYYKSTVEEDLDGYLSTLDVEAGKDRDATARMTRNAWSAVGTRDLKLSEPEISRSSDGGTAIARYTVRGTLFNKTTGDSFEKEMTYVAMLANRDGLWKIDRVTPAHLFMAEVKRGYEEYAALSLLNKSREERPSNGNADTPGFPREELRLHFDFTQEPADGIVKDCSGQGNDGRMHGGTWIGTQGIMLNGIDEYIEVPAHQSLHAEKGLTVIGDVTIRSHGNTVWHNLFWKGSAPDCTRGCENREYGAWINVGGFIHFTSTPRERVGQGQLAINTPAHIVEGRMQFACVIDTEAQAIRIYHGKNKVAEGAYHGSGIRTTDGPLTIGGVPAARDDYYLKGSLRSLLIYGRALPEEEIALISDLITTDEERPVSDPYRPDDIIVRGSWADVSHIKKAPFFSSRDRHTFKKDLDLKDGLFCPPGRLGPTEIVYHHDGSPLTVSGWAAILECLDYCGNAGSMTFIVKGDGKTLWESGMLGQNDPAKPFSVELAGIKELRLLATDGGNGNGEDWGAWLNLTLKKPLPPAPAATDSPGPLPVPLTAPTGADASAPKAPPWLKGLYALGNVPAGNVVTPRDEFGSGDDQIFICIRYTGLSPGTIVKGIWRDEGRNVTLQEFPVVITSREGMSGFMIRQPLEGWVRGNYRVDLVKDEKTVGTAPFRIRNN